MSNKLVMLERKKVDLHRLYGEVVAESDDLLLLHEEHDFQFDGYVVVRKKDISRRDTTESNDYCEKLMRKEGLWEKVPPKVKKLPLDSWHSLLGRFLGKVVILENERTDDFLIGPVVEVKDRSVSVHYFDGCGIFTDVERIPFNKITRMMFGDRYTTIHGKYLEAGTS